MRIRSGLRPIWRASITTQKDFAREADVPEQYLSDVLMGRRLPSDRLLKVIGFRRKVIYVRLPETKANGTPRRGICRVCGCTRGCMWVDDSHTLCSRCADE